MIHLYHLEVGCELVGSPEHHVVEISCNVRVADRSGPKYRRAGTCCASECRRPLVDWAVSGGSFLAAHVHAKAGHVFIYKYCESHENYQSDYEQ